jgi:exoribonuclease R
VGLLRTMPAAPPQAVNRLRVAARALGVKFPKRETVGQVLASLDTSQPRAAAFVDEAAELLRGAGYTPFHGELPADPLHAAVASPYAHVTAPLRRLADRYATEVCLCLQDGREVPDFVLDALPRLPEVMSASDRLAGSAERGAVDQVEAMVLAPHVGKVFPAVVLDTDDRRPIATIVLDDPAVRARCDGKVKAGNRIQARLTTADVTKRQVRFEVVG